MKTFLVLLGIALLSFSTSKAVAEKPSGNVVEMWEKCSITHILGGPAPVIIGITFFENGDVEYSEASNHRFRTARMRKEITEICDGLVPQLVEQGRKIEPLLKDQGDTERFMVSTSDDLVQFPRYSFREISKAEGPPDVVDEDPLSPRLKQLLRDLDAAASRMFGARHEYRFLRHADPLPPTAARESRKSSIDPVVQFLLTSAATDFYTHHPPDPVRFRDVRIGHVMTGDGKEQYRLCGQFLPAPEGGKAEWTPFVTIKTSGYEQWLGAQAAASYCGSSVIWDEEGDLSSALQSRLDALRTSPGS